MCMAIGRGRFNFFPLHFLSGPFFVIGPVNNYAIFISLKVSSLVWCMSCL
ncbi:hypothetical protein D0Y65_038364 [Glycine soja]|uniref:Uncharacterized protein n=1 Tax=Glycine soja TaxID=3848 RepID=A0A445H4H8_GLYSO|nr:hypothetical protein D0Y65_038364 [Glycine soja]